jgi:hypothetical protein
VAPKLLVVALVFALGAVGLAEDAPPPRPNPPARAPIAESATPAERAAAAARFREQHTAWREAVKAWEAALTPAQKLALKQQEERDQAARREAMERKQRLPVAADGYSWQDDATKRKLAAPTVARLARDKLAYGPTVKQSFEPYFSGPVFITSDSLLNAFHVLFEDTFREYEVRQSSELRRNLEIVFEQARDNLGKSTFAPADSAPAWRHAQRVLGPAMTLLGTDHEYFAPDLRDEIKTQVAKIRAAEVAELPAWLAPAEIRLPAIDYRACKPVGFYAADAKLSDYFRAVRWLQSVPFRSKRDIELAAIAMLGYGLNQAYRTLPERYFRAYAAVLGDTDTRGLPEAAFDFQNFFSPMRGSETWSGHLAQKRRWVLRDAVPHDEWLNWPQQGVPAHATPLLDKIEYHVLPAYRVWDAALFQELADRRLEPEGLALAMMLGSSFARSRLEQLTAEDVEAAARAMDAPKREGQARRESSLYDDYLTALRALNLPSPAEAPDFLRREAWQAKTAQTVLAGWAQLRHTFTLQAKRSELYFGASMVPPGFVEPNPEFFARMADLIERARALFAGNRDRWDDLASVTRKLEALAHKQLRRQSWAPEDERFLKSYGEKMGRVMGYAGNSFLTPNDDAPRWAEVHHRQADDVSRAVAVGRPRTLYVLYPWNGLEILCQGAVMTYYEYASKARLTDAEWKTLLDSPRAPAPPAWLRPYVVD